MTSRGATRAHVGSAARATRRLCTTAVLRWDDSRRPAYCAIRGCQDGREETARSTQTAVNEASAAGKSGGGGSLPSVERASIDAVNPQVGILERPHRASVALGRSNYSRAAFPSTVDDRRIECFQEAAIYDDQSLISSASWSCSPLLRL